MIEKEKDFVVVNGRGYGYDTDIMFKVKLHKTTRGAVIHIMDLEELNFLALEDWQFEEIIKEWEEFKKNE